MLKIKSTTGQKLTFDIDVQGTESNNITGKMRIVKENIEYGFDAIIKSGKMIVDLPALDTVILNLENGTVLESKIDIIANNETFTEAWKDNITIERPVEVKATVSESKEIKNEIKVTVGKSKNPVIVEGSGTRKKGKKIPKDKASHNLAAKKRQFPQKPVNIEEKLNKFISKYN